jgi:hypothetical protein
MDGANFGAAYTTLTNTKLFGETRTLAPSSAASVSKEQMNE